MRKFPMAVFGIGMTIFLIGGLALDSNIGKLLFLIGMIMFMIGLLLFFRETEGVGGARPAAQKIPKKFNKSAVAQVETMQDMGLYRSALWTTIKMILTFQTEEGQQVTTKIQQVVPNGYIFPGAKIPVLYIKNKPYKAIVALQQLQQWAQPEDRENSLSPAEQAMIKREKRFHSIYRVISVFSLLIGLCAFMGSISVMLFFLAEGQYAEAPLEIWLFFVGMVTMIVGVSSVATHPPQKGITIICLICITVIISVIVWYIVAGKWIVLREVLSGVDYWPASYYDN